MSRNFRFVFFALSLTLLLTRLAFAQETAGIIEGTVRDPNNAVVPNATITVRSQVGANDTGRATGFTRTVVTSDDGFYRVFEVPPGTYSVTVAAVSGFSENTLTDVVVTLGRTTPVNFTLTAGPQTTSITVTADENPTIDPTDNKLQTTINVQTFERLPKGVSFSSALRIDPAVRPEPLSGGFQIDGASGAENTFIIDGQEVTNFRTGQLNQNNNIPFQFVQEVQVKTSGFEAEFGGATGGVINVVTRGGGNAFNGEFGLQFRPSELQAGPRPFQQRFTTGGANATSNTFQQGLFYIRPQRPNGTDFFPTGNLSGPIIKDKVFFFASYTPQIFVTRQPITYFGIANSAAGVPPAPSTNVVFSDVQRFKQTNEYAFARLDANPTQKIRLTGTFTWNPIIQEGGTDAVTNIFGGQFVIPSFTTTNGTTVSGSEFFANQGGRQNSNLVTGKAIYTPTSNLVLSLRAGRSFLNEKLGSYGLPNQTRIVSSNLGLGNAQFGATGAGVVPAGITAQNFPNNFFTERDVSTRVTVDADATYLVNNFGGRHEFKGGYQLNRLSNDVNAGYFDQGVVTLYFGQSLENILGEEGELGSIGSGRIRQFQTTGKVSSSNQGFFVQDRWQPFNRLTLNLGVRAETEDVPSFAEGAPGISFSLGDKIAPRLGVAFDATGDGKTKVFASYGWFYDRFKYELPRGSFGGDRFFDTYFSLPASLPNLNSYTIQTICGVPSGLCPVNAFGSTTGSLGRYQFNFRVPSNSPTDNRIDPDLKAARQSEFTVGFERELFRSFVLSGRYTHKQIDRAIEDVGFLDAAGNENYFIANPGFGVVAESFAPGIPATPRAQRDYDALEIRFDRRLANDYYFNASYTFSRLFGNYSGLASSDEAGRSSPNVNRFFDLPFLGFTASGEPDNGRLATDRPHVFKFSGGYSFNWNRISSGDNGNNTTDISTFFVAQSGTPLTTYYTFYNIQAILFERGDLGRTDRFTQTDLSLTHRYRFGRDNRFTFAVDFNVLNAFNQAIETGRNTFLFPGNVTAASFTVNGVNPLFPTTASRTELNAIRQIFNGGLTQAIVSRANSAALANTALGASTTLRQDIRYNQPNSFQAPRDVRFGFRLIF